MSVSSIPAKLKSTTNRNKNESESWFMRHISRNVDEIKSVDLWRACFAEFIGVFFLAFFTIGVGTSKDGEEPVPLLQIALGSGFFVCAIITSLTTVSGGHVNPAISIGFLVANQITFVRFILYSMFQSVGAVAGCAVLKALLPQEYRGSMGLLKPAEGVPCEMALGMEVMITGLLLFGTMAFVDSGRKDVQGSIPYMVGLIVVVNLLTAGKISGASMNPVRALGPAVIVGDFEMHWIYWVGPLLGGVLGAGLYDNFLSTRPLQVIRRALERTKPAADNQRLSYDDSLELEADMIENSDHTKLSA